MSKYCLLVCKNVDAVSVLSRVVLPPANTIVSALISNSFVTGLLITSTPLNSRADVVKFRVLFPSL